VFDVIAGELAVGRDVAIAGFGKFSVTERAARERRNPATGVSRPTRSQAADEPRRHVGKARAIDASWPQATGLTRPGAAHACVAACTWGTTPPTNIEPHARFCRKQRQRGHICEHELRRAQV